METSVQFEIKAVAFDIGNVLLSFDHMTSSREIAKITFGLTAEQVFYQIFESSTAYKLWYKYETGQITTQAFTEQMTELLGLKGKLTPKALRKLTSSSFMANPDIETIIHAIKKAGKKVFIVSDICPAHWLEAQRVIPHILRLFSRKHIILSFEVGAKKPDPKIFHKICEITKSTSTPLSLENVVFIDDKTENVQGFRKLGGKSILHNCQKDSLACLKTRLQLLGAIN
jgi:FMN phosphatase YigB (HAD superfamily)